MLTLLLTAGAMIGYAQSDCFTYEDNEQTIIKGLTEYGESATSLTIPAGVITVRSESFMYSSNGLSSLTIYRGNPTFEGKLFGEDNSQDKKASTLTDINMGDRMSVTNMYNLLTSLGSRGPLETVEIEGYSGEPISFTDSIKAVLTEDVKITMPAALVKDQVFGDAKVYGRFTINKELISFCGNASFQDIDNGSNMLFYIADSFNNLIIHLDRVRYIVANQGILIHKTESSQGYCELPRIDSFDDVQNQQATNDRSLYNSNMLVGVTQATNIGKTDGDKTNLILKDAAFHPTSGGTIAANKAYLQIPTSSMPTSPNARFEISFSENETSGIEHMSKIENDNIFYDLQGRKVSLPMKGLYILNGKKVIVR